MGLAKKFFTVSGLTIVSRIFGVFRESVLVNFLGASSEMDAFTIAFKFPGFFRRFFAEGGFQSIFVPYYADFIFFKKPKGAGYFSSRIFSLIFWIMLGFSILVHIFAKEFVILMAPGFISTPEKLALATEFTRIIFPSVAFVSLSTIYSGILISRQKFFPFAMAPILVNIILIVSLFICKDSITAGRRISYGVLAAGIFQFLYMYVCVKFHRFPSPRLSSLRRSQRVKSFLKKLVPVLAGAGVAQVNIFVGSMFASLLPTGCITYLYCADRFVQLPLAIFGISMGIVLLPEITEMLARNKFDGIREIQTKSLLFTLRLTLPSVVGLISMAYCMTSLLYGHGKFDQTAVKNTADVLKVAAWGLPAFVISKIMLSVLFAQKDARTPVVAAIISIASNMIFSAIFVKPFGTIGIATAASMAGYVNVAVLWYRTGGWFQMSKPLFLDILRISVAASLVLFLLMLANLQFEFGGSKIQELIFLGVCSIIGCTAYILALYLLGDQMAKSVVARVKEKIFLNR